MAASIAGASGSPQPVMSRRNNGSRRMFFMPPCWAAAVFPRLREATGRVSDETDKNGVRPHLPDDLDWDREDVARAALGDDERRMRRVGFDLAPQAQDLDVDRAVVDLGVVQPGHVEQLVARQHALRRGEERSEQAELALGQFDRLAGRALQLAQPDVQLPA